MSKPIPYAEVAKEAVCSAFYGMEQTRFLGERPDPVTGWDVAYFRLSRDPSVQLSARADPKQVMVAVYNDYPESVCVRVEWLNFSGEEVMKGGQYLRFVADPEQEEATQQAAEQAVLRVLTIWSDVLNETGVTGPLEALAPQSAADDLPDLAVEDGLTPDDLDFTDER